MATVNKVLEIARNQIGVKESPAGSNNVKYNTWYYGKSVSGASYPWCMAFVQWVFNEAGMKLEKVTAGCTTFMTWAKTTGRYYTSNFKPGDIIFFDFDNDRSEAEHTGIIESVNGNTIISIEGNTSVTSNDNGGAVMRRTRYASQIIGVYRPKYDSTGTTTTTTTNGGTCNVELKVLSKGSTGTNVKALQILLKGYGYDPNGIDGSFGPGCDAAVRKFQKAKGLTVDGCVGAKTWAALLK